MNQSDEPYLIYSAGTQVVAQKDVMAANDRIAHPAGAVGVIVRSPVDRTHAYRVKFSDGFEAPIHHGQLVRLAEFKTSHFRESDSPLMSAGLYERVIYRCVIGSRAYGLDDEESDTDRRGIYPSLCSKPRYHWIESKQNQKIFSAKQKRMGQLHDVGEADGWRCWLCDEPVDPDMSPNDPRGASLDTRISKGRAKKKRQVKSDLPSERLAHKSCNTGKGTNDPVAPWPDHLIAVDLAPIIAAAERLERKSGREAMARCPTREDADAVAAWLVDRLSRLTPGLEVHTEIANTGGQHLVSLRTT